MDGSSISSTLGRSNKARPTSSCFCSPPDNDDAALCSRSLHAREQLQHLGDALVRGLHAQRDAAQLQVFKHA